MCENGEMNIGQRFKDLRQKHGFPSQVNFSEKSGISRIQVVDFEKNRHTPNLRTIEKFIKPLGITMEEFFTGQAPAYSKPDGVDKEERKYLDLLLDILRSGDKRAIMTMKLVIEQCGEKVNGRALKKEKAG